MGKRECNIHPNKMKSFKNCDTSLVAFDPTFGSFTLLYRTSFTLGEPVFFWGESV
jgi:hypothetical protein